MSTPNMGLTAPTVGASTGTWGNEVNADLDTIDAHNHIPGAGSPIPSAGLGIDADLTFAGYAAINVEAVGFTAQASAPSILLSIWVDTGGDLNFRNAAGTSVRITAGGQLDVSSVGGITGDYASVGASFYYDDAAKTYRALQHAPVPNVWASVSAGDVDLYQKTGGATNRVRLKSPDFLAASYALTFPGALPGAAALLQAATTGELSYNSSSNRAPVGATTLDANGTATLSGATTVSGAATFSSSVNLGTSVAAFTSVGVITATDFKQTTARVTKMPPVACTFMSTAGTAVVLTADMTSVDMKANTATVGAAWPLVLDIGERVTQVSCKANKTSPSGTLSFRFRRYTQATGVPSLVGSATNSASGPGLISLNITALAETITSGVSYWFEVQGGGTNGDLILDIEVSHTRP